jgi:hypothetical protein
MALDNVNAIEIHAENLDLVIEADPDVEGVARLMSESGADALELVRRGDRLRINQDGRYRGVTPPVLKLPAAELPTLGINLERGNLSIENIASDMGINMESGNLSISGGDGDTAINISRGNAAIRGREGDLACNIESGNIDLHQCRGDTALNASRGNITTRDCAGNIAVNVQKGEIALIRPVEQHVRARNTKGNVLIQGGSLQSADIEIVRGDINSSARLLFTTPVEPGDDFDEFDDDLSDFEGAIDDVVAGVGEEVRFNLGSVEFIAGEAGVRVSTGGTERFRAGPQGLVIRGRDGEPIFMANEQGVVTGSARRQRDEKFRFATTRGNILLDINEDQPARVELIVNRGAVQSDIPLVEVGRPGPRSTTRRYVGVSDSSDTDRVLIRARTNRGDIRVRTYDAPRETPTSQTRASDRDRQRRAILEALARGKLTTDEADILLAALTRDTS